MVAIIASIRPEYATAIYEGIKTVELRSRGPRKFVDRIYIYETAPVSAITGHVDVTNIFASMEVNDIQRSFGAVGVVGRLDATLTDLVAIFGGRDRMTPIVLADPIKYPSSIPLAKPPQSWRYVTGVWE